MSLIGFFDRGMSLGPDRVAYVQGDESWTFRLAYDVTCRVSNALLAEGLAAETRCAVLAGNSPLAWLCVLGVWRAGLAWVPLNPRSPPADHIQLIGGFDVEALFFQKAFAPAIETIRVQFGGIVRPGGNLTGVNFLIVESAAKRLEVLHELVPGAIRIAALVDPICAATAESTLRDVEAAARAMGCRSSFLTPARAAR